jgi:hypothetical protein
MKETICLFLILLQSICWCQNYVAYQKTFNRIDEDVNAYHYELAIKRLDSIYANYQFVYAKHCVKALQIACVANDSVHAEKFLLKCFKQGVPIWIIRSNELTNKALNFTNCKVILNQHDSLLAIYRSSINYDVAQKIDSLLLIDQYFTNKVNNGFFLFKHTIYGLQWLKNNQRQFAIIQSIVDQYGFPGEQLIGLPASLQDSSLLIKNLLKNGINIDAYAAYIMLIHYFSNPRKDINEKLLKQVVLGNIPAYQFGAINDFMARWGKREYGNYSYYNVWHHDPDTFNLERVNKRRELVELNTFEQQLNNTQVNRERRKNSTINQKIMTE